MLHSQKLFAALSSPMDEEEGALHIAGLDTVSDVSSFSSAFTDDCPSAVESLLYWAIFASI